MLWITMIVAIVATVIAISICRFFDITKIYLMIPVQFLSVFICTFGFSYLAAKNITDIEAIRQSFVAAVLCSLGILFLRYELGPLDEDSPREEDTSKKAQVN